VSEAPPAKAAASLRPCLRLTALNGNCRRVSTYAADEHNELCHHTTFLVPLPRTPKELTPFYGSALDLW